MSIEHAEGALAPYQSAPAELARPRTVQRLVEWAEAAKAAYLVAQSLVKTSFVPEAFRDKAHEATAAILAGDEVGMSPMASLRAFDIIKGTAAPKAITHRAIVQSIGHQVWQVEATDSRAVFRGQRAGSLHIEESVWTIDRARKLGIAGKDQWAKQPKAMLIARATSEVCRLIASDALLGLPYSVEELTDGLTDTDTSGGPPAPVPTRRTAQRRTPPKAVAAPEGAPEPPDPPAGPPLPGEEGYDAPVENPEDTPGSITPEQSTKLHAIFTAAGITIRGTKLGISSHIVGRPLESSSQLSKVEAVVLIDTLEEMAGKGDLAEQVAEILDAQDGTRTDVEGKEP